MAVTAVGVEIGVRSRFQRLVRVGRISELSFAQDRGGIEWRKRLPIVSSPSDESRLREGDELVAPIRP